MLATIVRNDMLGLELSKEQARTLERIYKKGAGSGHEREEIEMGLDALAYLILHFAKSNVQTEM